MRGRRWAAVLSVMPLVVAACTSKSAIRPAIPTSTTTVGVVGGPFLPTSATWISPQRGWVLGAGPALLRTADGGATWTPLPAPPTGAGARKVRFADERNGWLYGPQLWATHDGGSTWRRVEALPADAEVVDVWEGRAAPPSRT